MKKVLTGFVVLGAIVLVLVWDLFCVIRDGNYANTVSRWVFDISKSFMIVPFLAGVVAGHFWWPQAGGE